MEECSDDFLMAVAKIVGSSSAASMAIAERDRRVAAGEDAAVFWVRDKGMLFVGPRHTPTEKDSGVGR